MDTTHLKRDASGRRPHLRLRPTSRLGCWSVGLLILFFAAFLAMSLVVASGQTGGKTFSDNWWIAGPGFTAVSGAVGAFVAGLIALTRRGDRSFPVLVAVAVGALVTLFVLGEVTSPH
jgi:hypothetical protein